jgi:hypothetical protein
MKWTKEEMAIIGRICGEAYEMEFDHMDYEGPFDFEGDILTKDVKGGYRVMSWDFDEVYYYGSLEHCCRYITGEM